MMMELEPENSKQALYVAVLLYESSSEAPGYQPLYEESFILLKAGSLQEAKEKALAHGLGDQVSYRNEEQETITWSLKHLIDVNEVLDDDLGDGSDLYARHFYDYAAYARFEPMLSNIRRGDDQE
jgi:Domain of unknown function (DUF4288)